MCCGVNEAEQRRAANGCEDYQRGTNSPKVRNSFAQKHLLALAVCVLKSHPEYRYWPRIYRNSCSPLDGGCCCQNYLASLVIRITSECPTTHSESGNRI